MKSKLKQEVKVFDDIEQLHYTLGFNSYGAYIRAIDVMYKDINWKVEKSVYSLLRRQIRAWWNNEARLRGWKLRKSL